MPRNAKITQEEAKIAIEMQAPVKTSGSSNLFKSARKLSETGVKIDDGERLDYYSPVDFFDDENLTTNRQGKVVAVDGTCSKIFVIKGAVKLPGKFGALVRLTVMEEDESISWVSLSLGKNENEPIEERAKILQYFRTNTQPLGPVMFVALPSNFDIPFYAIQDAVPF